MSKKPNHILNAIGKPTESFLIFLLVGFLINLLGTGLSNLFWIDYLKYLQTELPNLEPLHLRLWATLILFIVLFVIIFFLDLPGLIRSLLVKVGLVNIASNTTTQSIQEQPCAGLVVIMSAGLDRTSGQPKTNPAENAIREHLQLPDSILQHCWIITTDSSLQNARYLKDRLSADESTQHLRLYYDQPIPNPDDADHPLHLKISNSQAKDPDETLKLVNGIYLDAQSHDLDESDLIVDITGGMKPQSTGAFLAASRPDRRIEYLTQEHPSQVIEIKVNYQLRRTKAK